VFRNRSQSGCRVSVAIPVRSVDRFFLASVGLTIVVLRIIVRPVDGTAILLVVVLLLLVVAAVAVQLLLLLGIEPAVWR